MSDSKKRLFVGFLVEPASSLLSALKRIKADSQRREMEVNWVPLENYHVTLNFLGSTQANRLDEIHAAIEAVTLNALPVRSDVRGLGAFPDPHHMRVIYAGVRNSKSLSELQNQLDHSLQTHQLYNQEERIERDYVPHLTLARLRKSRSGADLLSPWVRSSFHSIEIKHVHLFETLNAGPYPQYKILRSYPLLGTVSE